MLWKRGEITEANGGFSPVTEWYPAWQTSSGLCARFASKKKHLQIQSELKRNPQVLGNDFSTPKVKKVIYEKPSSSISVSASFKIVSR